MAPKLTKTSPNHYNGRNGWKSDVIVCHVAEGTFDGTVSWACNPSSGMSCHAVSGANGQIAYLVDFNNGAWCNGTSTDSGVRLYYGNATAKLVKERKTNANYFTYSIEHEGYSTKERKGALTEKQYQATLTICKEFINHMKEAYGVTFTPDREHLIGHYQIDPKGKPNCPDPAPHTNFPFDRLLSDIKAWMGKSDPAPTPTPYPTPTPAPTGADYEVKVRLSGYVTAADAMSGKNAKTTVSAGKYFVYKTSGDAVNVTKTKGVPGSWINGKLNVSGTVTPTPSTPVSSGGKITIKAGTWNVRAAASLSGKIMKVIRGGVTVAYTEKSKDGWYKIDGGWIGPGAVK